MCLWLPCRASKCSSDAEWAAACGIRAAEKLEVAEKLGRGIGTRCHLAFEHIARLAGEAQRSPDGQRGAEIYERADGLRTAASGEGERVAAERGHVTGAL